MKMQRAAIALTLINCVLLVFLLTQAYRTRASEVAPMLRGRGLQILDSENRIRAEILVHGPEVVNGTSYPDTVVFRLATPQRAPIVKLTASENGSALGLSDDSEVGGVQLYATRNKGNFAKVVSREGREQTIKP